MDPETLANVIDLLGQQHEFGEAIARKNRDVDQRLVCGDCGGLYSARPAEPLAGCVDDCHLRCVHPAYVFHRW